MKNKNGQAYMFLTPFLILVTIFYVIPAVLTVVMSFTNLDSSFVWEFNHFKNFIKIFKDPNTLVIVRNTLIFVGVAIVATVFLNLLFAVLTTYSVSYTHLDVYKRQPVIQGFWSFRRFRWESTRWALRGIRFT